jgi:poly(A) polymerase
MLDRIPFAYRRIVELLVDAGHEAYFVGGCVRDLLLGLEPKDFDITTSAEPMEVAGVFSDVEFIGAHFGVTLVKFLGVKAEVATFRVDGVYSDGRRPDQVQLTTDVREDVKRRDFTVNALLLTHTGKLVDYVGGTADLRKRLLRTVGNPVERFSEDPVRMLRAIKFACKKMFYLDADLIAAAHFMADDLKYVSAERVADELSAILTSGDAARGVELLVELGLSRVVLPELDLMKETPQNTKHHPEGDVLTHTLGLLSRLERDCSLTLALGALLHDVGKPATLGYDQNGEPTAHGHEEVGAEIAESILRRLKFSNEVVATVTTLVDQHMRFRVLEDMKKSKQLRFVRQPNFEELLELHRIDALSGSGKLTNYFFAAKLHEETPPEVIRPVRLVTGNDLVKLGGKPGPLFKEILTAVEDQQLEGTLTTREAALSYAYSYLAITGEVG